MGKPASSQYSVDGVEILSDVPTEFREILTPEALQFVAKLQRK